MPLIPSTMLGSDKDQNWASKLMGKKVHEVPKDQLPQNHRVLKGDDTAMTMDFNPDRYLCFAKLC